MKPGKTGAESWLIADVGATSCRCATLTPAARDPDRVRIYRNDQFVGLSELLADYLDTCSRQRQCLALAVAAPVHGDDIRMINRDWSFSGASLAREPGFDRVEIINDFHAIAYALPALGDNTRAEIGSATEYRSGNMAAIGPGSGLGASAWIAGDSGGSV